MLHFAESGHPVFRATSALERGGLRSKEVGKNSVHFNGSEETVELILRTVMSAKSAQYLWSSCRFVQRTGHRLDSPSTREHAENENWESMVVPTELPNASAISQIEISVQGNLLRDHQQKFAELPEDEKLTKLCSDAGFMKNFGKGQFFFTLGEEEPDDMQTLCREYTLPRDQETSRARGWIRGNTKIGPVWDVKVYCHQGRCCIDIMIASLLRDKQFLGFLS